MTKNRTPTPVYLDPGMHPGLEVKGLSNHVTYMANFHLFNMEIILRHQNLASIVHPFTARNEKSDNGHRSIMSCSYSNKAERAN